MRSKLLYLLSDSWETPILFSISKLQANGHITDEELNQMDERISIRLFALKYNLENLTESYEETKKDAFLEVEFQYYVEYEDNESFRKREQEYRSLVKTREYVFFTWLLNFTQCFYSLKEYLINLQVIEKRKVEEFFSRPASKGLSRKQTANDLKHNPDKDAKYDFQVVKKEKIIDGNTVRNNMYYKKSWFYEDREAVEHCTALFNDLFGFIKQNLSTDW